MLHAVLLIGDHGVEINILNASEDMRLDFGILLFQLPYQLLDLDALGTVFLVIACGAGVRKLACALNEMQAVIVAPCLYIVLADEIQRTDELHALKIGAVQLGHHGLYLRAVQHAHENSLYNVVIVVPQRDLVAAERAGVGVKVPAPHPRAQIARGFVHCVHRVEYVRLKHRYRHAQLSGVVLYHGAVLRAVAGVHDEELDLEGELVMELQLLKELGKLLCVFLSELRELRKHELFKVFSRDYRHIYDHKARQLVSDVIAARIESGLDENRLFEK